MLINDFISSDHLPHCFNVVFDNVTACFSDPSSGMDDNLSSDNWRRANDQFLYNYKLYTKSSLSKIKF